MTKREIENKANELIEEWMLDGLGWSFRWNTRMVKSVGLCRFRGKRHSKTIELSHKIFVDYGIDGETVTEEFAIDTILHEIAHALDYEARGKSAHDYEWKEWAKQVGADPTRTCDLPKEVALIVSKWHGICPECGFKTYWNRKPRKTYACTDCCNRYAGGQFHEDYAFRLTKNDNGIAWA